MKHHVETAEMVFRVSLFSLQLSNTDELGSHIHRGLELMDKTPIWVLKLQSLVFVGVF